jgi:hypothetical protein
MAWCRYFFLALLLLSLIGLAAYAWPRSGDYRPRITLPPARHLGECGDITFYWQSWLPPDIGSLALSPPGHLALGQPRCRLVSWCLWRVSVPFWAESLTTDETTLYCLQTPVANFPALTLQPRSGLDFPCLTAEQLPASNMPTWEIFLLAVAALCVLAECFRFLLGRSSRMKASCSSDHTLESLSPPPGLETPAVAEARRFARRLLFDRDARTPDILACALSLREAAIRSRMGRPRS